MGTVVFFNKGAISPISIKSFGVSVKEGTNPIGYFGTGLKYALAIYLREGCTIDIYSGLEKYEMRLEEEEVRGVPFKFITMNGEKLSYTTELGKNWETWKAFRELYCNALDEGGGVTDGAVNPDDMDSTYIIVKGEAVERDYHQRDSIVLRKGVLVPSLKMSEVEITDSPSKYIYYRGIRVFALKNPSILTYNILSHQILTEDRGLENPGSAIRMIERVFTSIRDKSLLKRSLTTRDTLEDNFDYGILYHWQEFHSEEFLDTLEELFEGNNDKANKGALNLYAKIKDKRSLKHYEIVVPTDIQQQQLNRAQEILSRVPSFSEVLTYRIVVVKSLGTETMALADRENSKIVLSLKCFQHGTKYLVSTIIEEFIHLSTGFNDHTRELQTHLFDVITSLIEEHIIKQPI